MTSAALSAQSICKSHDECQRDVQSRDGAVIQMADLPSDSCTPNRNGLVSHDVGSRIQPVPCSGLDDYPKVRRVVSVGAHLADDHGRVLSWERAGLHNYRWPWFAVLARGHNSHDVAAFHRASNSAAASIHFSASSSWDRSRAATSRATRPRTALDRASGTIKRHSHSRRARLRSRMAFMRSAASMATPRVTRYIVTRYGVCHGNWSSLDEGEDVWVDRVGVRGEHAVREAGVELQSGLLEELRLKEGRALVRNDLVVIPLNYQRWHVDTL